MKVRGNVMSEKCEERRDREGLVTVTQNFQVDRVAKLQDRKEGYYSVNGHYKEDANDAKPNQYASLERF